MKYLTTGSQWQILNNVVRCLCGCLLSVVGRVSVFAFWLLPHSGKHFFAYIIILSRRGLRNIFAKKYNIKKYSEGKKRNRTEGANFGMIFPTPQTPSEKSP